MEILEEKSKNKKCWNEEKMVAHAQLVAGIAYLTPTGSDPRSPVCFFPAYTSQIDF